MKRAIGLALILCLAVPLSALELKEGLVKLVLHEDSGRFSLYFLADVAKGVYEPLLFERDPRTSSVNLYAEGRLYRMGDSVEFRIGTRRNGSGADFVFKSAFCTVTQNFSFVKSRGSSLTDGIKVTITVENSSDKDIIAGLRVIVDSYLGETVTSHFSTNIRQKITTETLVDSRMRDEWINSFVAGKPGFVLPLPASGMLQADSVIMANWSRLNASPWEYEYNPTRNFTLQPYSINDSAIGLDWSASLLQAAKSRSITYILAGYSESNAAAFSPGSYAPSTTAQFIPTETAIPVTVVAAPEESASPVPAASQSPTPQPSASARVAATPISGNAERIAQVQTDYLLVKELIDRINAILSSKTIPSEAELTELREAIKSLEARKSQY